MTKKIIKRSFLAAVCFTALGACTTEQTIRGFIVDEVVLESIVVGLDNRNSIRENMGNPSVASTFDQSRWYYISSSTRKRSFLDERARSQLVVAITFDRNGIVNEVQRYTLADAKRVEPVEETTPTRGKTLGFWQQIFGNIGRFAGQGAPTGPTGPGGPNSPR